jgi:CheY-like chemotaxis protein
MDLAMPGIDGWETLRQLQAMSLEPRPVCAVVSANAFDKGLDNTVGLPPSDFLVKPVRREDVLAWLGNRLALTWDFKPEPAVAPPVVVADAAHGFSPADVSALAELSRLGYYRGFVRRLDGLAPLPPDSERLVAQWREWARAFRFEAITQQLQEVSDAHQRDGR